MSEAVAPLTNKISRKEIHDGLYSSAWRVYAVFCIAYPLSITAQYYLGMNPFEGMDLDIPPNAPLSKYLSHLLLVPIFSPFLIVPYVLVFGYAGVKILESFQLRKCRHYIIAALILSLFIYVMGFLSITLYETAQNSFTLIIRAVFRAVANLSGGLHMIILISTTASYFFWKKVIKPRDSLQPT